MATGVPVRAKRREQWGQRPDYHEQVTRLLAYIYLGYSVDRLRQLFPDVPIKTIERLKYRFG
jgi:hypothetical protein